MNNNEIEQIVKQVLAGMQGTNATTTTSSKTAGPIPKTARVAMLTGIEKFELQEYPLPEIGDDDMLVKVEGFAEQTRTNISVTHLALSLLFSDTRVQVRL